MNRLVLCFLLCFCGACDVWRVTVGDNAKGSFWENYDPIYVTTTGLLCQTSLCHLISALGFIPSWRFVDTLPTLLQMKMNQNETKRTYVIRLCKIDVSIVIVVELLMQRSNSFHSQTVIQRIAFDVICWTSSICWSAASTWKKLEEKISTKQFCFPYFRQGKRAVSFSLFTKK